MSYAVTTVTLLPNNVATAASDADDRGAFGAGNSTRRLLPAHVADARSISKLSTSVEVNPLPAACINLM
jgi:hypothetical protein